MPATREKKENLTARIGLRVTRELMERIERQAAAHQQSVRDYLRALLAAHV